MKISEYLEIFRALSYSSLFSDECLDALRNIQDKYSESDSSRVLYEVVLDKPGLTTDFSCRLYDEILKYYWLEFDYGNLEPCVFLEAVSHNKSFPIDDERKMQKFFGREKFDRVRQPLTDLTKLLESRGTILLNLGNLDSRGEKYFDSVRVETRVRTVSRVVEILKALSYSGDLSLIENTLSQIEPYAVKKFFRIAFEILPDRISDKIGVNFSPYSSTVKYLRDFMSFLVEKNLCLPEKAGALIDWRRNTIPDGLYIQDVKHFKISFEKNNLLSVKAYLRHSDSFII